MDFHRRGAWFAAGVIVAVIGGTITWAGAHGGNTSMIHGCVVPTSGYVRIVGPNDACKKSETAIDWVAQATPPTPPTRMLSGGFGSSQAGPCGAVVAGTIPVTFTGPTTVYVSATGSLRRTEGTSRAEARLVIDLVDPAAVDPGQDEDGVVASVSGHAVDSVVLSDHNDTIGLAAAGILHGGGAMFVAPAGQYEVTLSMRLTGTCTAGGGTGNHDLVFSRLDVIAAPAA